MSSMVSPASSRAISAAWAPRSGTVRSGNRPNLIMSVPTTETSVMARPPSGRGSEEIGEVRVAVLVLAASVSVDDLDGHVELQRFDAGDHVHQIALDRAA